MTLSEKTQDVFCFDTQIKAKDLSKTEQDVLFQFFNAPGVFNSNNTYFEINYIGIPKLFAKNLIAG